MRSRIMPFFAVLLFVFPEVSLATEKTVSPKAKAKKAMSEQQTSKFRAQILKIMSGSEGKLDRCRRRYLGVNPGQSSNVAVSFEITGKGTVSNTAVSSTLKRNAYIHACIRKTVESWAFPKNRMKSTKMTFSMVIRPDTPFKFQTPKKSPSKRSKGDTPKSR
ncbi:MAG: AgmX/PglI C-terminal domain-containing protein [Myxococcota bacterium]|nr:AgmX/PglI C-terminal domain-containing protein [Myxococcota bacterium]